MKTKLVIYLILYSTALIVFINLFLLVKVHYNNLNEYNFNRIIDSCVNINSTQLCLKPANFTNYSLSSINVSICDSSVNRSLHQRVVAYSFFGIIHHPRLYLQGISYNAELIMKYYPGWLMRIYHNFTNNENELIELQCKYKAILDLCNIKNLPGYGNIQGSQPNIWRFLTMADPYVDIMLSRDLDSNISKREVAAVNKWLDSSSELHVMRDHKYHAIPILGGTWGLKLMKNRDRWLQVANNILTQGKTEGGFYFDQNLLTDYLWPFTNQTDFLMAHDSYSCEKFNNTKPFPTKRLNGIYNFVGARAVIDKLPIRIRCPLKCRKDPKWIYC